MSTEAQAQVWTESTLANPHADREKADKVRAMFAAIARSYDLNNRVHSLWRDQAWRRFAVRAARVNPGDRVLDVACGTGDLTQAFAASDAGEVVGLDYTPQMLDIAREKSAASASNGGRTPSRYVEGDATKLAFEDATFDVVSIAFGLRNVSEPRRALGEFARVLRPGGRLVILEFERPAHQPMRWLYDVYCGSIMPRTATLIARDRSGAYKYLPRSVSTFMDRKQMAEAMREAGFANVVQTSLTMGICVCHVGTRS
ncbi:MAG: bifunctional demethylmenaquinone methyltransferase/2-methoxy-6-polyprenyl-1,4-benzoquinol methylase UbiE [Planctomycetota bacterium]|nr:bifunctional demethylmenaquinone methyltransferase/2-methoxy-6-polyprenyl-1,4-benzoquinol methylase UbiE [Planctomycetota bacterium]